MLSLPWLFDFGVTFDLTSVFALGEKRDVPCTNWGLVIVNRGFLVVKGSYVTLKPGGPVVENFELGVHLDPVGMLLDAYELDREMDVAKWTCGAGLKLDAVKVRGLLVFKLILTFYFICLSLRPN